MPLRPALLLRIVPLIGAALAAGLVAPAAAQSVATPGRDAPLAVSDLARLGSGGAVAALPTLDSPFLANPAHVTTRGLTVNVVGATAGVGGNVGETWTFYRDDLGPAIERGLDTLPDDSLQALYAEALRIGAAPKTSDLAVLAPSVRLAAGPVGLGVAVYGQSTARGRFVDGGAGVPFLDLYGQADLAVPVVAGVDLARTPAGAALPFGLRLGASATALQRRVTAKAETVDALDPDNEKLYVLSATGVRLAAGALASDVGLPGLDVGAEVSNVGGALDYAFDRSVAVAGAGGQPDDAAEIAALQARFSGRAPEPVVRLGLAYRPVLNALPLVSDAALALDYTSASTAEADQSVRAGLRLGARALIGGVLGLRAGLSQGMPSAGVALSARFVRVEYATYGVEDGRLLGQQPRRNHVVQLRLGRF